MCIAIFLQSEFTCFQYLFHFQSGKNEKKNSCLNWKKINLTTDMFAWKRCFQTLSKLWIVYTYVLHVKKSMWAPTNSITSNLFWGPFLISLISEKIHSIAFFHLNMINNSLNHIFFFQIFILLLLLLLFLLILFLIF